MPLHSLIEHIIEFTCAEERISSFWLLSSGEKVFVPDQREHADVVIAQPKRFNIKVTELPEDPEDVAQLAVDRGAARVTYHGESKELTIFSKYFTNEILDDSIAKAPGEVAYVLWDTFTKSIEGRPAEVYNRI